MRNGIWTREAGCVPRGHRGCRSGNRFCESLKVIASHDGNRSRYRFRPRHRWKQLIKRAAHGGPSTPAGMCKGRYRGRPIHSAAHPVGTGLRTVPVTCDGPESRRYFALRARGSQSVPLWFFCFDARPGRSGYHGASPFNAEEHCQRIGGTLPGGTCFVASGADGGHEGPWPSRWENSGGIHC